MATVRLFARLRELAGSTRLDVEGATVGEVVEATGRRVGPEFVAAVATARIWRNGEEAHLADPVDERDEIALLPPVSGGAATFGSLPPELSIGAPLVALLIVVFLNLQAGEAWWAAALVGVVGMWVVDVTFQMEERGRPFPSMAILVGVVAGAVISQALGPVGLTVALALSVMIVLGWGVGIEGFRSIDSMAPGALVAIVATAASGSLVLTRSAASSDPQAIDVYLLMVVLATVAGAVVDRVADVPYVDPFTVTAVSALVGAVAGALVWDLDLAGYLLVGLGTAVTLVAGKGLGSLLRTGGVTLTDPVPGFLTPLDGALLAAALYFPLIRLIL